MNSNHRALDSSIRFATFPVVITALAVLALGRLATAASTSSSPAVAAVAGSSPAQVTGSSQASVANQPAGTTRTVVACDPTRPDPVFHAPLPAPAAPPAYYHASWYGSAHLWTMLDTDGERCATCRRAPEG